MKEDKKIGDLNKIWEVKVDEIEIDRDVN